MLQTKEESPVNEGKFYLYLEILIAVVSESNQQHLLLESLVRSSTLLPACITIPQ